MKKLLKLFSLTLLICLFAMTVCAKASSTVYVSSSGSDTNAGTAANAAKATLTGALEALGGADGTIVITDNLTLENGAAALPRHDGTVTITSGSYGATLTVNETFYLGGKTVFSNIDFSFGESISIFCESNDTVFGSGITVDYLGDAPVIYGGYDTAKTGETASTTVLTPFSLQIDSGTWGNVYCGNRRNYYTSFYPLSNVDTSLTINGGSFYGIVSAIGCDQRNGTATLTINNGNFYGGICGIAKSCINYDGTITYTGTIAITINGGFFTNDIVVAERENEATLNGECVITLNGGDFSRINRIMGDTDIIGGNTSLILSENVDVTSAQSGNIKFKNSIADYPDPSIFYHDGWYYYTYSGYYRNKLALWVRRAANFSDIAYSRPMLAWSEYDNPADMNSLWAPQMYYFDGSFYIYATCVYTADEEATDTTVITPPRKTVVWQASSADPLDGFTYIGPVANADPEVYSFLSPRFIEWGGKRYMVNGGFFRAEDRVVGEKHYQSLFATEMKSPTEFTGKTVQISTVTEAWEISSNQKVKIQEGPFPYYASNGTLYLLYSANETAYDDYCTGLLRFNGTAEDSILDASLWYKYPDPIHTKNADAGIYSPGAGVLVQSPNGDEMWFIYHAKLTSGEYTYSGRVLFAQKMEFDANGNPKASTPPSLDTTLSYEMNSMPLVNRISGFNTPVLTAKTDLDKGVHISISPIDGATLYIISRDGKRIYSGANMSFWDADATPGHHTYAVQVLKSGTVIKRMTTIGTAVNQLKFKDVSGDGQFSIMDVMLVLKDFLDDNALDATFIDIMRMFKCI